MSRLHKWGIYQKVESQQYTQRRVIRVVEFTIFSHHHTKVAAQSRLPNWGGYIVAMTSWYGRYKRYFL